MIKEAIIKLVNKGDLTFDEARTVMNEIMSGETSPTQNAAFLAALTTKNTRAETEAEIEGCAAAMREHSLKVNHPYDVFDIVGTGGDNSNTFNISTVSSIVVSSAGVKVAKHGNRAASSKSGAADCRADILVFDIDMAAGQTAAVDIIVGTDRCQNDIEVIVLGRLD